MTARFTFGIYPGGIAGTDTGLSAGPEDVPAQIEKALTQLHGNLDHFLLRVYIGYHSVEKISHQTPVQPEQYLAPGRKLDLVVCFQSEEADMFGWTSFIRSLINQRKDNLANIQITEEANLKTRPLDGYYENSRKALVYGIIAAKEEVTRIGLSTRVGFNATPDFNPDKLFWKEISSLANSAFLHAVDYVGIDFFPDVFRPVMKDGEPADLKSSIHAVLKEFRKDMTSIGLTAATPLHVTENGWPTSPERTSLWQAVMLEKIIRQIYNFRTEFNITHYELFSLRDADSKNPDLFHGFGIMHDDYKPKEAFGVFQKLIHELR